MKIIHFKDTSSFKIILSYFWCEKCRTTKIDDSNIITQELASILQLVFANIHTTKKKDNINKNISKAYSYKKFAFRSKFISSKLLTLF